VDLKFGTMPMQLYANPDRYQTKKILVAATYAGLDIHVPKGAGSGDGKTPVLETDGGCIFTTDAIARYIARLRRDLGLYGHNLLESGVIDSWLSFCTQDLEVPLGAWLQQAHLPPAVLERAKGDVKKALTVFDSHLLHYTFVAGYQMSLADISLCCVLHHAMSEVTTPDLLDSFSNLKRWFNLCLAQPEICQVLGKVKSTSGVNGASKNGASPKEETPVLKRPAAAPAGAAPAGGDDAQIEAVGTEIRLLKEKLKGEGLSGKKVNDNEQVKALVVKMNELKGNADKAPAPAAKKEAAPKAEKKEKGKKADDDEKPKSAEEIEADRKKQLKTCIKEGGKRGVEIEGAVDMSGLQFFCTSVDAPNGDLEMLKSCLEAMNEKSDPTEEERKGGSGNIGKMIFSAGGDKLALAAYVPEEKLKELCCEEWLKSVLALHGGKVESSSKSVCIGYVTANPEKNVFPLKIRESMILEANNFLRKLGLFPEDKDDSDDMVFGDDDFPSM